MSARSTVALKGVSDSVRKTSPNLAPKQLLTSMVEFALEGDKENSPNRLEKNVSQFFLARFGLFFSLAESVTRLSTAVVGALDGTINISCNPCASI